MDEEHAFGERDHYVVYFDVPEAVRHWENDEIGLLDEHSKDIPTMKDREHAHT